MRTFPRRLAAVAVLGAAACARRQGKPLFGLVQFAAAMSRTDSHAFP